MREHASHLVNKRKKKRVDDGKRQAGAVWKLSDDMFDRTHCSAGQTAGRPQAISCYFLCSFFVKIAKHILVLLVDLPLPTIHHFTTYCKMGLYFESYQIRPKLVGIIGSFHLIIHLLAQKNINSPSDFSTITI